MHLLTLHSPSSVFVLLLSFSFFSFTIHIFCYLFMLFTLFSSLPFSYDSPLLFYLPVLSYFLLSLLPFSLLFNIYNLTFVSYLSSKRVVSIIIVFRLYFLLLWFFDSFIYIGFGMFWKGSRVFLLVSYFCTHVFQCCSPLARNGMQSRR